MDKLSERFKDWYGYGEGFKPGLTDAEFDVLVNEVAQLEAALIEIRNVANEVHEENASSLNPPGEDTKIVPLWVIDKCSKALNDEREWLEALKAGVE